MKKWIAVTVLAFATSAKSHAPVTETWTNLPNGQCQASVKAPSYFCSIRTDDGGVLTIYVTLQPDGTFTNGHISKSDLYCYNGICAPTFTSVNWAGANLSGSFSGTQPDGSTFYGNAKEVLGSVKYCAGKYGCHCQTGVVSGSGSVTLQ